VTERPQTTRNRLIGIKTLPDSQMIFIDTPGIHDPRTLLGKRMVRMAHEVMSEIDLIVFMTDSGRSIGKDREILSLLQDVETPVFLLINKIDSMKKAELLPIIAEYSTVFSFREDSADIGRDRGGGRDTHRENKGQSPARSSILS